MDTEDKIEQSPGIIDLELNSEQPPCAPNESIGKQSVAGFNLTSLDSSLMVQHMDPFNEFHQDNSNTPRDTGCSGANSKCQLQQETQYDLFPPELIRRDFRSNHENEQPCFSSVSPSIVHPYNLKTVTAQQDVYLQQYPFTELFARQHAREIHRTHKNYFKDVRSKLKSLVLAEKESKHMLPSFQNLSLDIEHMIDAWDGNRKIMDLTSLFDNDKITRIFQNFTNEYEKLISLMSRIIDVVGKVDDHHSFLARLGEVSGHIAMMYEQCTKSIQNYNNAFQQKTSAECLLKEIVEIPGIKATNSGRKRKLSAKLIDTCRDEPLHIQEKKQVPMKKVQKRKILKKVSKVRNTISSSSILEKKTSDDSQSERVIVKIIDHRPDRITNPLLEVPQGSASGEPNMVASEFLRLLSIYFPDPDTFPLSYYAKLLGIILREDITLEDQKYKWFKCDNTSDPWYCIPPLGRYKRFVQHHTFNTFLDKVDRNEIREQDNVEDHVDPIWLRLLNDRSWYVYETPRKSIDMKDPVQVSEECIRLAKDLDILALDLQFRVGGVEDAFSLSQFRESLNELDWIQRLKMPNHAAIIVSECTSTEILGYVYFDFSMYDPNLSSISSQNYIPIEGIMKIRDIYIKPRKEDVYDNLLIVLFGLAFEDASHRVAWAIVDTNSSMRQCLEKYFRVSYVGKGSVDENTIMVCDLDKCSYRYALLSKVEGEKENEAIDDFRMIVQLPYRFPKEQTHAIDPDSNNIQQLNPASEFPNKTDSSHIISSSMYPPEHSKTLELGANTHDQESGAVFSNIFNGLSRESSIHLDQEKVMGEVGMKLSEIVSLENTSDFGELNILPGVQTSKDDKVQSTTSAFCSNTLQNHFDVERQEFIDSSSKNAQNSPSKIMVQVKGESIVYPQKYCDATASADSFRLKNWNVLKCFRCNDRDSSEHEKDFIALELRNLQHQLQIGEFELLSKIDTLMNCVYDERVCYEIGSENKRRKIEHDVITEYQNIMRRKLEAQMAIELKQQEDENAVCDICFDGESSGENRIIFCDSCDLSVHQECYNIDIVPKGDYFCRACSFYKRDNATISSDQNTKQDFVLPIVCELCPRKQGAFVQVEGATNVSAFDVTPTKWVHLLCAKWLGLNFVDNDHEYRFIENVQPIKDEFLLGNVSCCLCQGMRGAYHKCHINECEKWMHVTCARSSGLCNVNHGFNHLGPIEETADRKNWTVACPDHSKLDVSAPLLKVPLQELIALAKTFPAEPRPKPPPKPFNKLNGKERSEMLDDPKIELALIEQISNINEGMRCEICDELIYHTGFIKCSNCYAVVHNECVLCPWKKNGKDGFVCTSCSEMVSESIARDDLLCQLCNKLSGTLVECFAKPTSMKRWKNGDLNPTFQKSLFGRRIWCHPVCGLSTCIGEHIRFDEDKRMFDCQMIILSHGFGFVKDKLMCALCGRKDGIKNQCSSKGSCERKLRFHATCARQAGLEVDRDGTISCFYHTSPGYNLRAFMEDMIEPEKKRSGNDLKRSSTLMSFECAAEIFNNGIRVLNCLGWAWQWAKWWVEYPSSWEPLLEEGQDEMKMSQEELRIVDSTPKSRLDDVRRCRLIAFSVALRNRDYDKSDGDDRVALKNALISIMDTRSLVGPLTSKEKDFFVEWLGRVYRSKSPLLGFGDNRIPVAESWSDDSLVHYVDKTPKFELGNRNLPGSECSNIHKDIDDLDLATNRTHIEDWNKKKKKNESTENSITPVVEYVPRSESLKDETFVGKHHTSYKRDTFEAAKKKQRIRKDSNSRSMNDKISTTKAYSPHKRIKNTDSLQDETTISSKSGKEISLQQLPSPVTPKRKRGRPRKDKVLSKGDDKLKRKGKKILIACTPTSEVLNAEPDEANEKNVCQSEELATNFVSEKDDSQQEKDVSGEDVDESNETMEKDVSETSEPHKHEEKLTDEVATVNDEAITADVSKLEGEDPQTDEADAHELSVSVFANYNVK